MATISEEFIDCLRKFDVTLENETIEYLAGMLDDVELGSSPKTAVANIREATEEFLTDANVTRNIRDSVYSAFLEGCKQKETGDSLLTSNRKSSSKTSGVKKATLMQSVTAPEPERAEYLEAGPKESGSKGTATKSRASRRKAGASRSGKDAKEEKVPFKVVATSQQSRFHTDTLETSNIEIDLHTVNISVNDVELLVDAHLKLKAGVKYGLVGANGVGKTVLMKCLSENILVGLPQNLLILHVAQLVVFDDNATVISSVLEADKKSMNAIREYDALQAILSSSKGGTRKNNAELNRAVYDIQVSRSLERLDLANKLATKRSGARGRDARRDLIKAEKDHADLLSKDPHVYITQEMVNETVAEVFSNLELVNLEEMRAKAQRILRGLGFTDSQMETPISTFSGGWRMKIALAKALFMEPNILLLDEPTNHLDLTAILWLQDYLINETDCMTLVVVSHDRSFLNTVCEETIIFRDKQLKYHAGNYDDYEKNTDEQRKRKQAMLEAQERRKKHILASIQTNIQQAKATGDDKRHGMVASRRKKLERLGMEKTEDGKRFKVSYYAGYHEQARVQIVVEQAVKAATIKIPDPSPLRYHGPILNMKNVSFRYPKATTDSIQNFSIDIELGKRVAFLGGNGCGKTTLLNLLVGKLTPTRGEVYRHPLLRIGYFSQHIVDELDPEMTPVDILRQKYDQVSEQECRAHFGSVGMSGGAVKRKIKTLSGGQRNRIALALVLFEAPHVLILDEITNHLDMATVENLVEALAGFNGALILVSHDVWFMKSLMESEDTSQGDDLLDEEELLKCEYYLVRRGKPVIRWEEGMDEYLEYLRK